MGRNDTPLNAKGESQVQALAQAMSHLPVDGVYSSPQKRALQTAEAIASTTSQTVQETAALAEVDFPRWESQITGPIARSRNRQASINQ